MIYNCKKCGLSKSDGAMGSVLSQCKCDWNLTSPKKEWVGLTDEEIWHLSQYNCGTRREFAKAIKTKLKEKNGMD